MFRSGDVRNDPVLDQTLQHLKFVLIKPRNAAETAQRSDLGSCAPGCKIRASWIAHTLGQASSGTAALALSTDFR